MPSQTPNHGYYKADYKEDEWHDNYNSDRDDLDVDIKLKGPLSERPETPPEDTEFLETEESTSEPGARWRYDGTQWVKQPISTDVVNADSVDTERGTISDPDGEPQLEMLGIGPANELFDEDTSTANNFYLDNGVLMRKHADNADAGLTRFILGRDVGIGIRKNDTLDSGAQGGTAEFIKNPKAIGRIILENDYADSQLAFESKAGGGIAFLTGVAGGAEADEVDRFVISDPQDGSAPEIRAPNLDYVRLSGDMRLFPAGSTNVNGGAPFHVVPGTSTKITGTATEFEFAPGFGNAENLTLYDGGRLTHNQATSEDVVWESDTTANRPASPTTGQRFFDTDLGQPIWYDGTQWVDATGTAV